MTPWVFQASPGQIAVTSRVACGGTVGDEGQPQPASEVLLGMFADPAATQLLALARLSAANARSLAMRLWEAAEKLHQTAVTAECPATTPGEEAPPQG